MSNERIYLDHAGATLPSPKLLERVANSLISPNLLQIGNPHSSHLSAQLTNNRIENIRLRFLFFTIISVLMSLNLTRKFLVRPHILK